jgi:glycosyltransferase involved in cell wall biosynthesis
MATRILFACQFSSLYGGVQHSMLDIVRNLDRTRFDPIVLCAPAGELPGLLAKEKVRVRTVGVGEYWRYSPRNPLGTLRDVFAVAREIVRLARAEDVRIVHTFDGMVFFAASLAKLYLADLKIIWLDSGFDRYRYHFRIVMRWCFKHAARVVTITKIRSKQLLSEGLELSKAGIITPGTDFHLRSSNSSLPLRSNNGQTVRIGIVGRIVPIKNFELFLQAARIVADTHPNVQFTVVGGRGFFGSELEYYDHVISLAQSLNLTDRVSFLAPTEDLRPILNGFDILVVSSHIETFGRTLVEAMALSKPVVATAVGGIPEVVADGEVGFLVPAGDAVSMAEKINKLVADAKLRENMGRKGYERVMKLYDIRMLTRKWEQLYETILQN